MKTGFSLMVLAFSLSAQPAHAVTDCFDKTGLPGSFEVQIESGGMTRTFLLDIPADYDPSRKTPVVFNFHGWLMTAEGQAAYTDMPTRGTSAGFIVIHPQGYLRSFNAGTCCGLAMLEQLDDVGFTLDMLDYVSDNYCIDVDRVHSTGFSNGGFMSNRLACELPDVFASIAPVSGLIGVPCNPDRVVPVHQSQGVQDVLVWYPRAVKDNRKWAEINGCEDQSIVYYEAGDVTCSFYPHCEAPAEVEFCATKGVGHAWVDEDWYHTTDENLAFFIEHPMP